MLAVGDEGLGAVEHVAIAGFLRLGAHALQVGTGARLGHGDGAYHLTRGELGQPAFLLLLGAIMQDVGRDDAGVQRPAERVEAGQRIFTVDHGLVGEGAAGAAIFLGHRGAEQTGLPGLGPDLALVHALLVPAVEMRHEFVGDEAAGLFLEEDQVLGHPGGAGEIQDVHGTGRLARLAGTNIIGARCDRREGLAPSHGTARRHSSAVIPREAGYPVLASRPRRMAA